MLKQLIGKAKGEPVWVGGIAAALAALAAEYGIEGLTEEHLGGIVAGVIALVSWLVRKRTVAFDPSTGTTVKPVPSPFPQVK